MPTPMKIDRYYFGGSDRATLVLVDTMNSRTYGLDELNAELQKLVPEVGAPEKLLQAIKYELQRQAFGAPVDQSRVCALIERINEALPSPLGERK